MVRFVICTPRQQHSQVKMYELGRTRSRHVSDKEPIQHLGKKKMIRNYLKNLNIDGRIIFRMNFKKYDMMAWTVLCRPSYID
jgi:hypothetical protein